MNFEVLEHYVLIAIFLANLFFNFYGLESLILYIILIVSFMIYFFDVGLIITKYLLGAGNNASYTSCGCSCNKNVKTHEIHEVVQSTTKHNQIIVNEILIVSKP